MALLFIFINFFLIYKNNGANTKATIVISLKVYSWKTMYLKGSPTVSPTTAAIALLPLHHVLLIQYISLHYPMHHQHLTS